MVSTAHRTWTQWAFIVVLGGGHLNATCASGDELSIKNDDLWSKMMSFVLKRSLETHEGLQRCHGGAGRHRTAVSQILIFNRRRIIIFYWRIFIFDVKFTCRLNVLRSCLPCSASHSQISPNRSTNKFKLLAVSNPAVSNPAVSRAQLARNTAEISSLCAPFKLLLTLMHHGIGTPRVSANSLTPS